jgi:hypothetical protein
VFPNINSFIPTPSFLSCILGDRGNVGEIIREAVSRRIVSKLNLQCIAMKQPPPGFATVYLFVHSSRIGVPLVCERDGEFAGNQFMSLSIVPVHKCLSAFGHCRARRIRHHHEARVTKLLVLTDATRLSDSASLGSLDNS